MNANVKNLFFIFLICTFALMQVGCPTNEKAQGIQQKAQKVKSGIQEIQRTGGDPRPIAQEMQEVKALLDRKDFDGANAKLDQILAQIDDTLAGRGGPVTAPDRPTVAAGAEGLYRNTVELSSNDLKMIRLSGYGNEGIFDPAMTYDPKTGNIWMTFSSVDTDRKKDHISISTGIAYSNDKGKTWKKSGVVNESFDVTIPAKKGPNKTRQAVTASWRNEVSAITYDPGAPANERWKVVWHHYLGIGKKRHFQHSWIALKTAPSPEGPWSSERKLFVGKGYNSFEDDFASAPEVSIHKLDSELSHCVGFSEPGLMATADALYMSLQCGVGPAGGEAKIFLLKLDHRTNKWGYKGDFVRHEEAKRYNFGEITGSELFMKNGKPYLIVTVTDPQKSYGIPHRGCMCIEIEDLETARLSRQSDGTLNVQKYLTASDGTQGGLCTYVPEATGSGVVYGLNTPGKDLWWTLYNTGVQF